MAQVDEANNEAPVRISLKLEKETIMLGEPMSIIFEVTNLSGEKLCLDVGGDYCNRFGRPERFDVSVTAEDGTVAPKPEADNFGGFIGCDDSYWFVRLRVAQGLKNVNTKEALAVLHKLLKDDNEEVREAAKETLKTKQADGTKSN